MGKANIRLLGFSIAAAVCLFAWLWVGNGEGGGEKDSLILPEAPLKDTSQEVSSALPVPPSHSVDWEGVQRNQVEARCTVQLVDPQGAQIDGQVWLLQRTKQLNGKMQIGGVVFTSLWGDSLLAEDHAIQGEVSFTLPKGIENYDLVAVIAASGFAPTAALISPGNRISKITLLPSAPIALKVVGEDGIPISNARCWLRPTLFESSDLNRDWLTRFQSVCFGTEAMTDNHGMVVFPTCYSGLSNTIQVFPGGNLSGKTMEQIAPGSEIEVVCAEGFPASGLVASANTGAPLAGAKVLFSIETQEGSSTVLSYTTGDDGRYRVEALPAGHAVISITARAAGHVVDSFRIFNAEALDSVEHDFSLASSQSMEFKLLTEWGEPISNAEAMLRRQRFGWESPMVHTNGSGVLAFPEVIPLDASLELLVLVEAAFWTIPDEEIVLGKEVVIHGLSRIGQIKLGAQLPDGFMPHGWSWVSHNSENQGEVFWNLDDESPLLPSGAGYLALHGEGGARLESSQTLSPGKLDEITFAYQPATISFQWPGPEDAIVTLSSRSDEWLIDAVHYPSGSIELNVWEGNFSLSVESSGVSRSWQSLRVKSPGLDLGVVSGEDKGAVYGMVADSFGHPMADVSVELYSSDKAFSRFATTDGSGEFELGGAPPGSYFLYVSGTKAYGSSFPEITQEVFLRPSQDYGPVNIVLSESSEDGLIGLVEPPTFGGTYAFLIQESGYSELDLSSDGAFRFASPLTAARVGASCLRHGVIWISSQSVLADAKEATISSVAEQRSIRLVDENGAPWYDLLIYAYVDGMLLGHYATPDSQGKIKLYADRGQPLSLQFRTPNGRVMNKSLDDLLASDSVVLQRNAPEVVISVVDEKGKPLSMAAAMHFGVGDVFQADGYGRLHLPIPDPEFPFLIEVPGHLSMWDAASFSHELLLPTLVYAAAVNLPDRLLAEGRDPAVVVVRVQPMNVSEQALFSGHVDVPVSGGSVALPGLPMGALRIQLLDADSNILAENTMNLVDDGQVLMIP